ncbi:MAG: hypothetical protein MUQ27_05390 [Acidimicrobiia bacterium]|nr:hypothetical protein [Acidimicrobiia bacterium]
MSVSLAAAVDDLYRDVVMDPDRWSEEAYGEWMANLTVDPASIDRQAARSLRRAIRMATKLQRFWSSPDAERYRGEESWEARVDVAVGIPAWRPALELAEQEFDASPSQEAFVDVRRRFRVVNGTTWMEGVEYDEWVVQGTDDPIG